MPASEALARQVRHALGHLYDPGVLRQHPLISMPGLSGGRNPHAALRDALIAAIEALKPPLGTPVDSRAWRVYKLLHCRYVQQLDQAQTAHQLGFGVRQLRREQRVAVQALADVLCEKFGLNESSLPDQPQASYTALSDELSWLKAPGQQVMARVEAALSTALPILSALATTRRVEVRLLALPELPPVGIHPSGLRQAVISAGACAIRRVSAGTVECSAVRRGKEVIVQMRARCRGSLTAPDKNWRASLEAARSILGMTSARLDTSESTDAFLLTMTLPALSAVDVLVVDDNADLWQLFDRYTAGTRYQIHGVGDATQFFAAVAAQPPHVIILDVMIPGVDGWEILGRLRQHPLTSQVPIIVCTVLPERDLALALGASAFLAKPVNRSQLLQVLDQTLDAESQELR